MKKVRNSEDPLLEKGDVDSIEFELVWKFWVNLRKLQNKLKIKRLKVEEEERDSNDILNIFKSVQSFKQIRIKFKYL